MCMEDIRIMRRTAVEERILDVASAASVVLVPQNPDVVAVTLDNQGPNDVTISLLTPVTSGRGMLIKPGDPPHRFDLMRDGNAVTRGIFGVCAAAQTAVVVAWVSYLGEK